MEVEYGKCHCGCGGDTKIAPRGYKKKGIKKGCPMNFIHGHSRRINIPSVIINPILCACGCGRPTPVAKQKIKKDGYKKGDQSKFIKGHYARLKSNPNKIQSYDKLFWSKVDIKCIDECWEWKGPKDKNGYGSAQLYQGERLKPHRIAFIISGGSFTEEKKFTCHSCDNPACCNPAHLWCGSPADNARDRENKGRGADWRGENGSGAILTNEKVFEIRRLCQEKKLVQREIGVMYGITQSHVSSINTRRTWTHLP